MPLDFFGCEAIDCVIKITSAAGFDKDRDISYFFFCNQTASSIRTELDGSAAALVAQFVLSELVLDGSRRQRWHPFMRA